jgi:predicted metal-dependent enzyme (double-stranded beta helix superfamily)
MSFAAAAARSALRSPRSAIRSAEASDICPAQPPTLYPASRAAAVARLAAGLEAACSDSAACMAEHVERALAAAATEPQLLAPEQRLGCTESYRRHLILADPAGRFAALALVWWPGHASPVHCHHTWCAYTVLDGWLDETLFAADAASDQAVNLGSQRRTRGATSFVGAGLGGIHQLRNTSDAPAISLHVYGIGEQQIATHVNRIMRPAAGAPG